METGPTRIPGAGMLADARRLPTGTARGFVAFLRDEQTHFFVLSALVGLCAAGVALGVRWFSELITTVSYGSSGDMLEAVRAAPFWLRLFVPLAGGVLAGLIVERASRLSGGGGLSGGKPDPVTDLERRFHAFWKVGLVDDDGRIGAAGQRPGIWHVLRLDQVAAPDFVPPDI